jgi:hypothetical protein
MVERSLAVLGLAIRTLGSVPARPQAFVAFGLPATHTGHYIHSVANAKNAKKPGGISHRAENSGTECINEQAAPDAQS